MSNWRSRLVENLQGNVLEIGVGEGDNLRHYRHASHVWGIEPDAERVALAQKSAATAVVSVTIDQGVAEQLPYADAHFDHVVSSLVFCSVTDQHVALAEVARVLKPGGVLHMVEHIRPRTPLLAWLADRLTPWWSRIENNCHLNRPTLDVLGASGWRVTIHRRRFMLVRLSAQRT